MRIVWATVAGVLAEDEGFQKVEVVCDPDSAPALAVCYPTLTGSCEPGDRVVVNTTAVDLGLGTGGVHFVIARQGGGSGVVLDRPSGGRVMKLRYSPLQLDVASVEEGDTGVGGSTDSTGHLEPLGPWDVGKMPVVCCGLHSQVVPVAAAIKDHQDSLRVAYVMTDQAALCVAFSDSVRAAAKAGLVDLTVTCGQAFGGDLESVNLHSGLLAARHVGHADVCVVSVGPGVVGTASAFGHGGVSQGEAINAVAAVGGIPVAVVRMSFADRRERHRVVSHHTRTALGRVAVSPALVPIPVLPPEQAEAVENVLESSGTWRIHSRVDSDVRIVPDARGVPLESMGRTPDEDPAFFLAAAAAGRVAGKLAMREEVQLS